jgi:hypothetical protein
MAPNEQMRNEKRARLGPRKKIDVREVTMNDESM